MSGSPCPWVAVRAGEADTAVALVTQAGRRRREQHLVGLQAVAGGDQQQDQQGRHHWPESLLGYSPSGMEWPPHSFYLPGYQSFLLCPVMTETTLWSLHTSLSIGHISGIIQHKSHLVHRLKTQKPS